MKGKLHKVDNSICLKFLLKVCNLIIKLELNYLLVGVNYKELSLKRKKVLLESMEKIIRTSL